MSHKFSFVFLLTVAMLLLNFSPIHSQLEEDVSIMIGYSKSFMFPLLDGGKLDFEKGEEVWCMSLDKSAILTLVSPSGEVRTYYLQPFKQTLLKSFTEDDEEGQWILKSGKHNLTIQLSSREKLEHSARLKYRITGDKLVIEVADHGQETFIVGEGVEGYLIPAGVEASMRFPFLNSSNEESYDVVMDLIYPGEFTYSGELADRPYSITMEKLAARIIGKLKGDTLSVTIPRLHAVGAGGLIPVRIGEATLKIRYVSPTLNASFQGKLNYTSRIGEVKVHVVDEVFREWAGQKATRSLSYNIEEALNKTLRVITYSAEKVTLSYAAIPLTSFTFYEQRLNKIIGNLSVIVEGHQSTVKDDRLYVLLSDSESALSSPVNGSSTDLMVHAYVNNFHFYDGKVKANRGQTYFIPVELHSFRINILFPNGTRPHNGVLRVNGFEMNVVNGSASYLLPTGRYMVEFNLNEWVGKTTVELKEDATLQIVLVREPTLLDILKVIAGVESAILIFSSILTIKMIKTNYKSSNK